MIPVPFCARVLSIVTCVLFVVVFGFADATAQTAPEASRAITPPPRAKHVLLIGIDGFGAYAWEKADMPNIKRLAANGAYSLEARCVVPSISAPNWGTHLAGAGPESHGYTSNAKAPGLPPRKVSAYGRFPGIFGIMRDAFPDAEMGVVYDWPRIHELVENKALSFEKEVFPRRVLKTHTPEETVAIYEESTDTATTETVAYLVAKRPRLTFVYLRALDETGHMFGHDTAAYYATLKKIDAHVGKLIGALKTAGIERETVVMLISDHGGHKKGHSEVRLQVFQTPWIISGAGVRRGHKLESTIVSYDTAATIAQILGVTPPQCWRGRPVQEAFAGQP
jgi:arylsulfatase A-like enzyme